MTDHDTAAASARRTVLQSMTVLPMAALWQTREALAQATGGSTTTTGPVRVDTKGLTARIKFEHVISGPLADLNGKYKLRVTELTLIPKDTSASTTTSAPAYARSPWAR